MIRRVLCVLAAALLLAALLLVPDGKILSDAQNDYYIGETPAVALAVSPYGTALAVGALLALLLFAVLCVRGSSESEPVNPDLILSYAALSLALGTVFARLLYCLVEIAFYAGPGGIGAILRWWEGGLSMTGALAGTVLAAWLVWKHNGKAWEALAMSLPAVIVCARFGERFTGMGIGRDVDFEGLFAIPDMFGNVLNVWLIEMIVAILIWAAMIVWKRTDMHAPSGGWWLAAFVFIYGALQILMESLRSDQHMIWGFVKSQQLFSFLAALGCVTAFGWNCGRRVAAVVVSAAVAGAVFGIEKALDRLSIPAEWLYLVFFAVVAGYIAFGISVMRRALKVNSSPIR